MLYQSLPELVVVPVESNIEPPVATTPLSFCVCSAQKQSSVSALRFVTFNFASSM